MHAFVAHAAITSLSSPLPSFRTRAEFGLGCGVGMTPDGPWHTP